MPDREPLSQAERSNLIIGYFDSGGYGVPCPSCHTPLAFAFKGTDSGWMLVANCRRCGLREGMEKQDDPITGDGDVLPWAGWEPLIVNRYFHNEANPCPACGAGIIATSRPGPKGETVHFRCPRCLQKTLHMPGE